MTYIYKFTLVLIIVLIAITAYANQWTIDPDHSEIRFEVKHIHTTVTGQFSDFKGDLFFNPKNPETSKFNFTVTIKSVDTNNGKRDNHLRSKDFFNSDKYPVMAFKSSKIVLKENNVYELKGMMTIKDVTKEMDLEFRFLGPTQHPFDKKKQVAGFQTEFTIARLDFNVGNGKFLKMGVVGEDVHVELAMEAHADM